MTSPFTPSPTDGAIEILRVIFGPVMDSVLAGATVTAASASSNMLGAAFGYFNSGILFFGSLILMFVTVFGISNSANDGVALGKKWSTFYTPIRSLVAAGSLIPTASGYAGIQLALLLIVTYSVGFASNMWKAVVEQNLNGSLVDEAVRSVTESPNFNEMILSALKMQVCAQGVNDAIKQVFPTGDFTLQPYTDTATPVKLLDLLTFTNNTIYFSSPNWPAGRGICGELVISTAETPSAISNSFSSAQISASLQSSISKIRDQFALKFMDPNGEVGKMAARIVKATNSVNAEPLDPRTYADEINKMQANMIAEIKAQVNLTVKAENASIVDKYTARGWVYAGSLWTEMASIKDAIRGATLNQNISYTKGTGSLVGALSGSALEAAEPILARYLTVATKLTAKTSAISSSIAPKTPILPQIKTNFERSDFESTSSNPLSIFKGFILSIGPRIVNSLSSFLSDDKRDPILKLKDAGDYLMGFAQLLLASKAIIASSLEGVHSTLSNLSNQPLVGAIPAIAAGISKAFLSYVQEIFSLLATAIYTMLYAGYFLSIWIPLVPFYVFAMGVVGWIIFVVEMLAAGVLWMAAHTTPAREDSFIGSQTQGYLLVMSGFFRPALMVLGLVASHSIMGPAITYVNEGFMLAFNSIQTNSVTGLLSVAGFILVYVTIIGSIVMLIFSLPQTLPDRILKWIGAGIGDMGEQNSGQRIEQAASSQSRQASQKGATAGAARSAQNVKDKSDVARADRDKISSETSATAQASRDATMERIASAVEGQGGSSTVPSKSSDGSAKNNVEL
jgi:conjugal transfer/type IV secretion protein DotA/TraY